MEQKILDFIVLNDLTFQEGERNSNSTILSGYALYIGITDVNTLIKIIDKYKKSTPEDLEYFDNYEEELTRVFNYAKNHDYGKFWNSEDAKTSFKF